MRIIYNLHYYSLLLQGTIPIHEFLDYACLTQVTDIHGIFPKPDKTYYETLFFLPK
jgi:hypothetical protein